MFPNFIPTYLILFRFLPWLIQNSAGSTEECLLWRDGKFTKRGLVKNKLSIFGNSGGIGCGRPRLGAWVGIERNCPEPPLSKAHCPHIPAPDCFYSFPSHNAHTIPSIAMPPCNCRHPRFYQASHSRVFFRRSRLFFREAAFFSGGEGCEWGAKQPTVGKSGDKAKNEFSGFIPLAVPRKGFSPHIPASRLFVHFHTTMPTTP